MIVAAPSETDVEVTWLSGETGLLATAKVRIDDNQGATVLGPVSPDRELGTTGIYVADLTMPAAEEQYTIIWSPDGSFDADTNSFEDLLIIAGGATASVPPLVPAETGDGPQEGPCSGWVSAEDVADCCSVEVGSDFELFDDAATSASQLLWRLSGRNPAFKGSCQRVVRPGSDWPCGLQVIEGGYVIGWENATWDADLSKVLLPNYPVTEIVEVKIDGVVLDPDEYRLDGWRWLQRMDDADGNAQFWPGPQRMGRDDSAEDTFSVRYLHGTNPPQPGIDAAAQLACEVYKSCPGNEGVAECALPKNATRVTRQGITIELNALYYDRRMKTWATGMSLVDWFLNAYNPHGLKRPPMIWSADHPHFAKEVGTAMGS